MAKVRSFLRLTGSVGETTFLKDGTGPNYRAQDKLVISPDRFKSSPSFARVRENASEFAHAGAAGKLIRNSVNAIWQDIKDNTRNRRMLAKIMSVLKTDVASPRGHRNLVDADITLLRKFSFNVNATIESVFKPTIVASIDRVTGHITVAIPSFVPILEMTAPASATHFQIVAAGSELDFEMQEFKADIQHSAQLPFTAAPTGAITLTSILPANSTRPLFQFFGVRFYQQVSGLMYPVLDAGYTPVVILDASKV